MHFEFYDLRFLFSYIYVEVLYKLAHLLHVFVHVAHSLLQEFNLLAVLLHVFRLVMSSLTAVV